MSDRQRLIRDPQKKVRISSVQSNLVVIFGMLLATIVVTLMVFIHLSAQEVDAEKEMYRMETVEGALDYAAFASQTHDMDEMTEFMERICPIKGTLYLLDREKGTIDPGGLRYRVDRLLSDMENQPDPSKSVLRYRDSKLGKVYLFYAPLPDDSGILLYAVTEQTLLAGENGAAQPVLTATLVLLLIAGIVIYVFTSYIIKPIFLIQKTIHGMATGTGKDDRDTIPESHPLHALYTDLNNMIEKYQNMVAKEYSTGIMKTQAELDALQSQINPHFLYNTLDSIRGIAIVQGARNIEVMIKALSDMFRYSISRKGPQVKLKEELANIQNYIMIQQYRFNNKFMVTEQIEPDTKDCLIPKLIVQPIVENAVFHGLEPKQGKGHIVIKAERTQKRLILHIEDDGIGIAREELIRLNEQLVQGISAKSENNRTHIGLFNVNQRIRLNYGEEYGLRIYGSENYGTTVEIVLPVNE